MNRLISSYLSALRQVQWQEPAAFADQPERAWRWLSEQGSLSYLMKSHCQEFGVEVLHNEMMPAEQLDPQEQQLLMPEACLQRQVILKGDNTPWVLGRTLIPHSSLASDLGDGQTHDFRRQGETPLGVTIFNTADVKRDALQIGWAHTAQGDLLARRSRLWMNHKPLLVAELFLPTAPIYSKERA